jgi:hypothetical protein
LDASSDLAMASDIFPAVASVAASLS